MAKKPKAQELKEYIRNGKPKLTEREMLHLILLTLTEDIYNQ